MASPVLFWDIDGTLIDCGHKPLEILLDTIFRATGKRPAPWATAGRTDGTIVSELLERIGSNVSPFEILSDFERRLAAELHTPKVLTRVLETLRHCQEAWLRSFLLTWNTRKNAETKLRKAGIEGFFDGMDGCFCIGVMTREEVAMQAACLLSDGAIAIVLGDTPADIAASKAIERSRCIAIATGQYGPGDLTDADRTFEILPMPEAFVAAVYNVASYTA